MKHYSDNGTKKRNLTKSKIGGELRKIKTNFETEKSKLDENRFRDYFSRHNRKCIFVLFKIKVGTGRNQTGNLLDQIIACDVSRV